jgi:hypothetical protein
MWKKKGYSIFKKRLKLASEISNWKTRKKDKPESEDYNAPNKTDKTPPSLQESNTSGNIQSTSVNE